MNIILHELGNVSQTRNREESGCHSGTGRVLFLVGAILPDAGESLCKTL